MAASTWTKANVLPRGSLSLLDKPSLRLVVVLIWGALMAYRYAWVAEDAFITFRTVENFVHGYGLRWNIYERVQAYTNPLWMMLHIPFYWLWENIDFIDVALSLVCTIAAAFLTLCSFSFGIAESIAFVLIPIFCSKTLGEYAFSGLENPLSTLLFAAFGFVLWRRETPNWFWLSFIISLSMVNRLDTVIAYVPVFLLLLWRHNRQCNWKAILKGILPIVAWLGFSLFYYGFVFPNTMYAKLYTQAPFHKYWSFGIKYLLNYVVTDPVMAGVTVASFLLGLSVALLKPSYRGQVLGGVAMGMALYCLYITRVGGSFVSCRFMSLPAFMALWIMLAYFQLEARGRYYKLALLTLPILSITFFAITGYAKPEKLAEKLTPAVRFRGKGDFFGDAYRKESSTYYDWKSLWDNTPIKNNQPSYSRHLIVQCSVGHVGFYAARRAYLIDTCGLADALLARLPAPNFSMIGHAERKVPQGYLRAALTGDTSSMKISLAVYYAILSEITKGDLLSLHRLHTILLFNLHYYDRWLNRYIASEA